MIRSTVYRLSTLLLALVAGVSGSGVQAQVAPSASLQSMTAPAT